MFEKETRLLWPAKTVGAWYIFAVLFSRQLFVLSEVAIIFIQLISILAMGIYFTKPPVPLTLWRKWTKFLMVHWNEVVTDEDTVYFIGNIGGYCTPFPEVQLSYPGRHKHLARGNRDTCIENQQMYFETVTDVLETDDGGRHITLCRYPINRAHHGDPEHGAFRSDMKFLKNTESGVPAFIRYRRENRT
ncbi:MAG: hypothetical protein MSB10_02200 [Clostridiales bacterium]|uniref:hypothetical protein n=1 Tax=Flavonifractor porci TaxID=3133422 RepID=UPI0030AACFB8|nr:hypothetical protein [Clostridiales bacterium]